MLARSNGSSRVEALRSTAVMGGSTAVSMLIQMVRIKVVATLLGPGGVGLTAIYDSVLSLARTAVDLGINSSGARQIAAATGSGDRRVIATTVITLRRVCLLLGTVGALALFLARGPISRLAFGNTEYATEIGWLAIIPLFSGIAGGQSALLQGMRRIGDLAKLSIFGTLTSTVLSIPMLWVWGTAAIPIYLIVGAGVGGLVSWTYVRRIQVEPIRVPLRETILEAQQLLQLGIVLLASGLMTTGALFALRILVTRQEGIEGVGQFQAASSLSMIYVGFVLQAMGTDFYPRLTAVATDNTRCNELVNEQAEISIVLALPGILATLAAAPWVISAFYSTKFHLAGEILCWQVTGMLLRVNSWPMGFILLAKGRRAALFWTDFAAYSVYVALGWLGLRIFGLPGTGMAFLGLYLFHWAIVYATVRKLSGFRWSPSNQYLSAIGVLTTAAALVTRLTLPEPWATGVGGVIALGAGLYCLKTLALMVGPEEVNQYLRRFRVPFQLTVSEATAGSSSPSIN